MYKGTELTVRAAAPAILAAALALLNVPAAAAPDVAAVLSSDSGPYSEAYAAFKTEIGRPVAVYDASKSYLEVPEDIRYAAVFGAKATALQFPPDVHLVYALTPLAGRGRLWHEISMVPEPAAALAAYKALQPGLRRLAIFWAAYPGEKYMDELDLAGDAAGIEVISVRLKGQEGFPERLRRLMGKMDAFWLMPDPALISQSSIMVLASFACANGIPFYAPTEALMQSGATASYSPGFAASGAAAARALKIMYDGGKLPSVIYVPDIQIMVNEAAAQKCGWPVRK